MREKGNKIKKDVEGFTKVNSGKMHARRGMGTYIHKKTQITNQYEVLEQEEGNVQEKVDDNQILEEYGKAHKEVQGNVKVFMEDEEMEMQVEETEDVDMGELDLEGI